MAKDVAKGKTARRVPAAIRAATAPNPAAPSAQDANPDAAPPGLRERKRIQTHAAILAAAEDLFRKSGIDGTAMDAIAQKANVSIASLYNYFPSKDVLLAEIIEQGIADFIQQTEPLFSSPFKDALAGYTALIRHHFEWFDAVERLWLKRFAAHALLRVDAAGARYAGIERDLQRQIFRMTEHLAKYGKLKGTVSHPELSKLIWSVANSEFYAYVSDDQRTADTVTRAMRKHLRLILD